MDWDTKKYSLDNKWAKAILAGIITHVAIFFICWIVNFSTGWMWSPTDVNGQTYRVTNWVFTFMVAGGVLACS